MLQRPSTTVLCLTAAGLFAPALFAGKSDPDSWGKIKNQSKVAITMKITDKVAPIGKVYIKEYGKKDKEVKLSQINDKITLAAGKTYVSYFDTTNGAMGLTVSFISGSQVQKVNIKKIIGLPPVILVYERKQPAKIFNAKFKHGYFNEFSSTNSFVYFTDLPKPAKPAKPAKDDEDESAPTDEPGATDDE